MNSRLLSIASTLTVTFSLIACGSPEGLADAKPAKTTVKFDFFAKPLPEIPLPNDIATRYDETSPTLRRVNASLIAPTAFERRVREQLDALDGWGLLQGIAIPFSGPIDPLSVVAGHSDDDYDPSNDVVYLVNIDKDSEHFGELTPLDFGIGNYPVILEDQNRYWSNDPRGWTISLTFEEADEDLNDNGVLDPGEDTDADGVLDQPNYLPGRNPAREDLAGRADALMPFYEKETHTLIGRPVVPLEEKTTYAVVVTRRLLDAAGEPVGSPFPWVNHASQTDALSPLAEAMKPHGVSLSDIAFTWSYTTQSVTDEWIAVRDGLYGHGIQGHIGREFPAEVAGMEIVRDPTFPGFANMQNPYIVYQEDWLPAFNIVASQLLGVEGDKMSSILMENARYIDYHAIGWYDSPQLFERRDEAGRLLPLSRQNWPVDLLTKAVQPRSERVHFHLMVPRKEISARGEGKPAPTVIIGHGYTSNRFDLMIIGSYLVRHGVAVLAIDSVSHGIVLSPDQASQAQGIIELFGLKSFLTAITDRDRALDLDGDGVDDSGGDFWTAYLFHTRDNVRQTALDYMQLTRILRTFDGSKQWAFAPFSNDPNLPKIAGDFDGDGEVDLGGDAPITMLGASLGGIMSAVVGGVEPEIKTTVPIAAGGGLTDVSPRSIQGGVKEAIVLRLMGPIYLGTGNSTAFAIDTVVPIVNDDETLRLGSLKGVQAGDFLVVENLTNKERGCGWVRDEAGTLRARAHLPSDTGDHVRVVVYEGDAMILGDKECGVKADATVRTSLEHFGQDVTFHGRKHKQGEPLISLAEGAGLRRASPDLRRMFSLGQMIIDRTDPAVMSQYIAKKSFTYPGTGQSTGHGRTLVVTTVGDMNVPASTGITIGRAAGLIDYLNPMPGHDVPMNQVLIDNYTAEATEVTKRFTNPAGQGVHMDVENFSNGGDFWLTDIPRLTPKLHPDLGKGTPNTNGGYSAAIFPFAIPTGQHGFPFPGDLPDRKVKQCQDACTQGDCGCATVTTFDTGSYLFNMFGRYISTDGTELPTEACLGTNDCAFLAPPPPERAPGR